MALVLITGGNRGIGFAIAQAIATRIPKSTIIIGCRSTVAGEEAVDKLKGFGVDAAFDVTQLDIEDDASIANAVADVDKKYGKLDVLVNNAAKLQLAPADNPAEIRTANSANYNNCITSNALVTKAFLPLLRKSEYPRVIMNSSTRGSFGQTAARQLPRVTLVDYCIAKAGLNMLALHFQVAEDELPEEQRVAFWTVSPGHCKTAFNNYRGTKDPIDGAEVIVRLLEAKRGEIEPGTFWEVEEGEFRQVPW